jgi:hypothetical protein
MHKLSDTLNNVISEKKEMQEKLESFNKDLAEMKSQCTFRQPVEYDPDVTAVIYKLAYSVGEDLQSKVIHLLEYGMGLSDITPVRCKRTPMRNGKPGLVKAEFSSLDEKLHVLRNKSKLKAGHYLYRDVYIRTSKCHTDRINEQNIKTVLSELPQGKDYRFTGNGKLVKVDQNFTSRFHNDQNSSRNPWHTNTTTNAATLPYPVPPRDMYSSGIQTSPTLSTGNNNRFAVPR